MKLLLLGATGLVGGETLTLALGSDAVSEVIAPTRKPLAPRDRLVNPVGSPLETLLPEVLSRQPDAVICALGTTQAKAGSQEAFRDVDYALALAVARAAHKAGIETFALVSAMGASLTSRSFYYRTKGEVERDIGSIGFRSLTICRPSLIEGARQEVRRAEHLGLVVLRGFAPFLPKRFHVNPAPGIAAALIQAVIAAKAGAHVIASEHMR